MNTKIGFLLLSGSLCLLQASAKEYPTRKELEASFQSKEINRRHWTKANRESKDQAWQEACAFNFSYASGFNEYETIEQREDFYEWLSLSLKKKGHEVKWVDMALQVIEYLEPYAGKSSSEGLYANLMNKLVFDSTFSRLQELYKAPNALQGAAAKQWDDEMIRFEQEDLLQAVMMKMDIVSLEKVDRKVKGKGLNALCVKKKLRFNGDLRKSADRIKYAQDILLPFVAKKKNAEFQKQLNTAGIKANDSRERRAAKRYMESNK